MFPLSHSHAHSFLVPCPTAIPRRTAGKSSSAATCPRSCTRSTSRTARRSRCKRAGARVWAAGLSARARRSGGHPCRRTAAARRVAATSSRVQAYDPRYGCARASLRHRCGHSAVRLLRGELAVGCAAARRWAERCRAHPLTARCTRTGLQRRERGGCAALRDASHAPWHVRGVAISPRGTTPCSSYIGRRVHST